MANTDDWVDMPIEQEDDWKDVELDQGIQISDNQRQVLSNLKEKLGKPGITKNLLSKDTLKELPNQVLEDLPSLGAGVGESVASFPGAAVGAYLGKSGQNLYNTFYEPEKAPKTAMGYITEPFEEAANAVSGNRIAAAVPSALKAGQEFGKKALDKSGQVANYILKKMGNIVASVPEKFTETYLKAKGKIEARPLDDIMKDIVKIHDELKEGVNLSERRVSDLKYELQSKKEELALAKQKIEEQFTDQRYHTSVKAGKEKESFDKASGAIKEGLKDQNVLGLRDEIIDSISKLKDKVNNDSIESYVILGNQKGSVSSSPLKNALRKGMEDLKLRGKILTKTDQHAFDELSELMERINQLGPEISFPEAKYILQRIGHDTTYNPNAGAYADVANAVKQRARRALDSVIKSRVPEYAKAMQQLDTDTRLLKELSSKFGTPEAALSRLSSIASDKGKHIDYNLLKQLQASVGYDFERPIQEYIQSKNILKTPSLLRSVEENLPEFQKYKAALAEQEHLAVPETRRKVRDKILQSREQKAVRDAEAALAQGKSNLEQSRAKYDPARPFSLQGVQGRSKSLNGARSFAPKEQFDAFEKATGKNFQKEIEDRAILDSFEKSDTNGARKTLAGKAIGKAVGGIVGAGLGYAAGGDVGASAGAVAGLGADKYAGKVFKSLLNRRINASQARKLLEGSLGKFTEPLIKAAEQGDKSFSIMGSMLSTDPEFRKLVEGQ